jgi:chromosome segregation ATPase
MTRSDENERLNARLDIMRSKFSALESTCSDLREQLETAVATLAVVTRQRVEIGEKCEHLTEERELLNNVEIENARLKSDCESLKMRLEGEQSEKSVAFISGGGGQEFEDFQNLRQVIRFVACGVRAM